LDTVFALSPLLVLPFWVLIIFLPNWQWTVSIVSSPWIVAPVALLFSVLLLPHMAEVFTGMPTLESKAALFSTDRWATVVWTHIMALDLFAARWVYLDYRSRGYGAIPMGFLLAAIFRLGPLGLLVYLLIRQVWPGNERPTAAA